MNNIQEFDKCANCGACYNACPTKAISVISDIYYKLVVDDEKCINCGLCKGICPVNNRKNVQSLQCAYSGIHKNAEIVKQSSSGGAFTAISEYVLSRGGIVFAAGYGDDCRVVNFFSTEKVSLDELRRSKYVESNVGESFKDIKEKLEQGTLVCFCGVPCQVAGLKSFLKIEYDNLITCDFSCGGMPSHVFYNEYLDYIEKKLKSNINSVNFRPKLYGWKRYSIEIKAKNGKKYRNLASNDPYFHCFLHQRFSIRDYCYECQFATNHYSDIILADFWKYKGITEYSKNDSGISLIITNSKKGDELICKLTDKMDLRKVELDKASYNIVEKKCDDSFIEKRKAFLNDCQKYGFIKTAIKPKKIKKIKGIIKYKIWKLKNG